jgi:hypothetical protein
MPATMTFHAKSTSIVRGASWVIRAGYYQKIRTKVNTKYWANGTSKHIMLVSTKTKSKKDDEPGHCD